MPVKSLHIQLLLLFSVVGCYTYAQNVDLENALGNFRKKFEQSKKLKISGGISAGTTYSLSTAGGMRDPFVYTVSGNMNFSYMGINIPVTLNLTNAGFSYSYKYPRLPSRLGLHPKYKWLQAHIGDFSMNFSPYTMNGFQLVGAGVDLQPKGKWKYSAFYGRFQKAVPYAEGNGNTIATYKRIGAGAKIGFTEQRIQSAFSFVRIGDIENSLGIKPDSLHIFPQSNLAVAFENKWKIKKSLQFDLETGVSFLTNDIRAKKDSTELGFYKALDWLTKVNASTSFYKAFKTGLSYSLGSSNVGISWERIDPGYQTLGAYYFNNDLENVTVNFAQQLFKNKLNLSMSAGMQHDDLKKEKTGTNTRVVMSVNASVNASQKFTSSFSYSNFQTVTNVKPQFQYINQLTPYDNLDTLDYRQLSQNANANFNFILRADKERSRLLNVNLSFQDSYDKQGGLITKGNASQFYNIASSYSSTNIPKNTTFAYGFNATYNTIDTNKIITAGPTGTFSRAFFDKKLRANIGAAYNVSIQQKMKLQEVVSGRFNASYTLWKKHQLGLNGVFMKRKIRGKPGKDFSTTLTYSYSF